MQAQIEMFLLKLALYLIHQHIDISNYSLYCKGFSFIDNHFVFSTTGEMRHYIVPIKNQLNVYVM